jgi:hypothetical protein
MSPTSLFTSKAGPSAGGSGKRPQSALRKSLQPHCADWHILMLEKVFEQPKFIAKFD